MGAADDCRQKREEVTMDVGIKAVLSGFSEATKQVAELNRELNSTAEAAKKVETAGSSGGVGVTNLAKGAAAAEEGFAGLSAILPGVTGALGGGLVAAAGLATAKLVESFNSAKDLGEQLALLSSKTNLSAENLGSFSLVAASAGMKMKDFGPVLEHLTRALDSASGGTGAAADAFARLGISVRNEDGTIKTADQAIKEIAERFSTAADGAGKTSIAATLLGTDLGTRLIPALNKGSESIEALQEQAKKMGLVMSDETVKALDLMNKNMAILQAYGQSFQVSFFSPLIEGLKNITLVMREAAAEGKGLFGQLGAVLATPGANTVDISIPQLEARIARSEANQPTWSGPYAARMQAQLDADKTRLARLKELRALYGGEGADSPNPPMDRADDLDNKTDKAGEAAAAKAARRAREAEAERKRMEAETQKAIDDGIRHATQAAEIEVKAGRWSTQEQIDLLGTLVQAQRGSASVQIQLIQQRERAISDQAKAEIGAQRAVNKEVADLVAADLHGRQYLHREVMATYNEQIDAAKRLGGTNDEVRERLRLIAEDFKGAGGDTASMVTLIEKELAKIPTNAELRMTQFKKAMGDGVFDVVEVWQTAFQSLQGEFLKFFKGQESVGDLVKGVWASVVQDIEHQFANLAARAAINTLLNTMGDTINTVLGALGQASLGNVISSALKSGTGSGSGTDGGSGGGGNILGNIASSLTNLLPGGNPITGAIKSLFGGGGSGGVTTGTASAGAATSSSGLGILELGGGADAFSGGIGLDAVGGGLGLDTLGAGAGVAEGALSMLGPAALFGFFALGAMGMFDKPDTMRADPFQLTGVASAAGFSGTGRMKITELATGKYEWTDVIPDLNAAIRDNWPAGIDGEVPIDETIYGGGYGAVVSQVFRALMDRPDIDFGTWNQLWGMNGNEEVDMSAIRRRFGLGGSDGAGGLDSIVSSPSLFMAGELGKAERVTISPLAGAAHRRGGGEGGGVTVNVSGISLMDAYSAKNAARMIQRMAGGGF